MAHNRNRNRGGGGTGLADNRGTAAWYTTGTGATAAQEHQLLYHHRGDTRWRAHGKQRDGGGGHMNSGGQDHGGMARRNSGGGGTEQADMRTITAAWWHTTGTGAAVAQD